MNKLDFQIMNAYVEQDSTDKVEQQLPWWEILMLTC